MSRTTCEKFLYDFKAARKRTARAADRHVTGLLAGLVGRLLLRTVGWRGYRMLRRAA